MVDDLCLEGLDLSKLSLEQKIDLIELLQRKSDYQKFNKLETFKPYEFQHKFYQASLHYRTRFLMAGNRIGKTFSEAFEFACHATGRYPEWWPGHKFNKTEMYYADGRRNPHDLIMWCVGITGDSTRKVLQKELFGTESAKEVDKIGTGAVPKDCINFDSIERDGHIIKSVKVKHFDLGGNFDGYTTIEFRSTQQGEHVLMGSTVDYIWLDEEDAHRSLQIYAQCTTRTATTNGFVTMTATPENGKTDLVSMFLTNEKQALYLQKAGWADAPHFTPELIAEMLGKIPKYQHAMRMNGEPQLGSGLIYDMDENEYIIQPIEIPDHWKRVAAVDIGIDHPTAVVWSAYDPMSDIIYVYDCYRESGNIPAIHATAINSKGGWIPVVLPHDADNTERGSGRSVLSYYQESGVNCLVDTFYNPLDFTGKKNNFVEPGIMEIFQRMKTGRIKIFSTCFTLLEELKQYHRKEGKIVKKNDDLCDALRYSTLSVIGRGISANEAGGSNSAYYDNWNSDFNTNY